MTEDFMIDVYDTLRGETLPSASVPNVEIFLLLFHFGKCLLYNCRLKNIHNLKVEIFVDFKPRRQHLKLRNLALFRVREDLVGPHRNHAFYFHLSYLAEKAMAPHSSTLAWKIYGWRSLVGCSPWGH